MLKGSLKVCVSICALALSSNAVAKSDAPAADEQILPGEIIVTAQKRAERLQEFQKRPILQVRFPICRLLQLTGGLSPIFQFVGYP
jgi:hypothetical protein